MKYSAKDIKALSAFLKRNPIVRTKIQSSRGPVSFRGVVFHADVLWLSAGEDLVGVRLVRKMGV